MAYGLTLVTAPATEPVMLSDARAHLRIDDDDTSQDSLIQTLIQAAREYIERILGRALVTQTWKFTLDRFPRYSQYGSLQYQSTGLWTQRIPITELSSRYWPDRSSIRLPKSPVQNVTAVTYIDDAGVTQTLAASKYLVDVTGEPARIAPAYGEIWPVTRQQMGAVNITFVAGYGASDNVPASLKAAIKLLVAHWHENREAIIPGSVSEMPLAVESLLASQWTGHYV